MMVTYLLVTEIRVAVVVLAVVALVAVFVLMAAVGSTFSTTQPSAEGFRHTRMHLWGEFSFFSAVLSLRVD